LKSSENNNNKIDNDKVNSIFDNFDDNIEFSQQFPSLSNSKKEDINVDKDVNKDDNKIEQLNPIKRNNFPINIIFSFDLFDKQATQLQNNKQDNVEDYNEFFNFSYGSTNSKKRTLIS
jgi:hypothetical protein